jgi:hypothetical protein
LALPFLKELSRFTLKRVKPKLPDLMYRDEIGLFALTHLDAAGSGATVTPIRPPPRLA